MTAIFSPLIIKMKKIVANQTFQIGYIFGRLFKNKRGISELFRSDEVWAIPLYGCGPGFVSPLPLAGEEQKQILHLSWKCFQALFEK